MSKASQRRESERQKRFEKKMGVKPALMRELRRLGPLAFMDSVLMWKLTAESGKKRKAHADDVVLNNLMDRHRASIEVITSGMRGMTVDESYDDEPSDVPVPGYAILESSDGTESSHLIPMSTMTHRIKPSPDEIAAALFKRAERDTSHDVLIWVFGCEAEHYPTFCLGMTKSGARAARILIKGKWIIAQQVDNIWMSAMAEIDSDIAECESPETVAVGTLLTRMSKVLPQLLELAPEERDKVFEAIGFAFGMAQEPFAILMARMGDALVSAEAEASDLWSSVQTGERDFETELRGVKRENGLLQAAVQRESRQVQELKTRLGAVSKVRGSAAVAEPLSPVSLATKMSAFF